MLKFYQEAEGNSHALLKVFREKNFQHERIKYYVGQYRYTNTKLFKEELKDAMEGNW
jgi:hypothetical protein